MTDMSVKLGDHFVRAKRDSGAEFVSLGDGAPQWLKDAVREAHVGDLPNDWIYEECRAACEAIDAGDLVHDKDGDDSIFEYADGRVDIYTKDLFQWAADFCLSDTWADAVTESNDMGSDAEKDLSKRIGSIQFCALRRIADTILEASVKAKADAGEGDPG